MAGAKVSSVQLHLEWRGISERFAQTSFRGFVLARHSGARPALAGREPGISLCFALNMSGFRVRVREGALAPRNDELGRQNGT
jgi:hypothetical protein